MNWFTHVMVFYFIGQVFHGLLQLSFSTYPRVHSIPSWEDVLSLVVSVAIVLWGIEALRRAKEL